MHSIAKNIKMIRKEKGWTQQQLADLLFSAVNLTRQHKLDSEMVLREKSRDFVSKLHKGELSLFSEIRKTEAFASVFLLL